MRNISGLTQNRTDVGMRRVERYRSIRALEGYVLAEQARVAKQAYRPGSAR